MTEVRKLGLVIVAAIALRSTPSIAASSCELPGDAFCPPQCAGCRFVEWECTYETTCFAFSDDPCSPGDVTLEDFGCFLGSSHRCGHFGFAGGSQCYSCAPLHYGPDCNLCPGGGNCNGAGFCDDGMSGSGTCSCDFGYSGAACQYSRWNTCNGHGAPQFDGRCACDSGWAGLACNVCDFADNYYPRNGTCSYCLASTTCTGNGFCNSTGSCVCNEGFTGSFCDVCAPGHYAYPACRFCEASTTCSGHGTCGSDGRCQCEGGRFGASCNSCGPGTDCGGYACSNGTCLSSCATSNDCAAGNYCSAGQCVPKLGDGASCGAADACTSGHCVDRVCCDSTCGEQCATCNAPGSVGHCAPAVGAPGGGRPACAGDGTACNSRCDGVTTTQCTFPDEITICRSPTCAGATAIDGAHCDGAGTCGALVQHDCGLYGCGQGSCLSSCGDSGDCAPSAFCAGRQCEIDTQPPAIDLRQLPAYTSVLFALFARVTDNGRVVSAELIVNGARVPATLFSETLSSAGVPPLHEGANTVLVRATDGAGNVGALQQTITLDTIAPSVAFLSPTPGQAIGTPQVDATVSVVDASPTNLTIGTATSLQPAGGGQASATVALAGAGLQTISATATDLAGNRRTISISVFVDLDAPIADVDVAGGAIFGPLADDVLPLTLHVDDAAATTVTVAGIAYPLPRGGGVVHAVAPLVAGANPLAIHVTSETGKTTTLDRTVFYDTTPPVAAITIPADGSFIRAGVELSVEASDAVSGVALVQFQVDGEPPVLAQGAPGEPWVLLLDTTRLVDGPHAIAATVLDRAGNATVLHASVTVDNTRPTVQLTRPAAGAYVAGTVSIEAGAADQGGVAQLALTANGAPIGSCPAATSCTVSYDTTANPDGALVVAATAVDRAGNHSAPASVEVMAVNHIPASFITSPIANAIVAEQVVVAVNVIDAYFASVECFVDGVSLGRSTDPSFTQTVSTVGKLDGAISVSCTIRDLAGNTSTQGVTARIQNWTLRIEPQTLNLKSKGNPVKLTVSGDHLDELVPPEQHALALVVPGGSPVPYTGSGATSGSDLSLVFDRASLEASIRAGIAVHAIDPNAELNVHLYAGARDLGSAAIRIKE